MKARGGGHAPRSARLLAGLALLAPGCAERVNWPDPLGFYREATGQALARRLPPPGLDGPSPHLGLVPARPDRPSSAALADVKRGLLEDRARAATPRGFGAGEAPPAPDAPGSPPVPGAPPPPPRLAAAPAIAWTAEPAATSQPEAEAIAPGTVPAPPPPELLAPAPPPLPDLLRR